MTRAGARSAGRGVVVACDPNSAPLDAVSSGLSGSSLGASGFGDASSSRDAARAFGRLLNGNTRPLRFDPSAAADARELARLRELSSSAATPVVPMTSDPATSPAVRAFDPATLDPAAQQFQAANVDVPQLAGLLQRMAERIQALLASFGGATTRATGTRPIG